MPGLGEIIPHEGDRTLSSGSEESGANQNSERADEENGSSWLEFSL